MIARFWMSRGLFPALLALTVCGCMSAAIEENQRQLAQQQAELDHLKAEVAELKAGSTYAVAPSSGGCDEAVASEATRHGGQQFGAGNFEQALGYYQDALKACPGRASAELNIARA